jgi:hypothetical protein
MAVAWFALMVLAFFAFSLGAARWLLKGTALAAYTFEAAFLLGPMLIVAAITAAGYRDPTSISPAGAWLVLLLGLLLTAVVCFRDRRELSAILWENRQRLAIILAGGAWAAAVLFFYFPGNIWGNYYYLGNGEYISYAHLAAVQTGHWTPTIQEPVSRFALDHHLIRYGQDLVAAATALVANRHPINVVFPLSIFYRFQYAIALGLVLHGIADGRRRPWLVAAFLWLDGYLLVETFSFTTSFMSSNSTIAIHVVYLALLAGEANLCSWRTIVLGVLANLFLLLTYPEFLLIVKAFELVLVLLWVMGRQRERWLPVLGVNVLTFLLHPTLVAQRAVAAYRQVSSNSGWNIFGDPRRSPLVYLSNHLSLGYAHVPSSPFAGRPWLVVALAVVVLGGALAGCAVLVRRHRLAPAVAAWVGMALLLHALPFVHDGKHFYGAVKFLTQTTFVPLAAWIALCAVNIRVVRGLACAGAFAWGAFAAVATVATFIQVPRYVQVYDYRAIRSQVAIHQGEGQPIACLVPLRALFLWHFAANELRANLVPLSLEQYRQLHFGQGSEQPILWGASGPQVFEGLFVIDDGTLGSAAWIDCGIQVKRAIEGQAITVLSDGRYLELHLKSSVGRVGTARLYRGTITCLPKDGPSTGPGSGPEVR